MPDTDIELAQPPLPKTKLEHPFADSSEPESFYRDTASSTGMSRYLCSLCISLRPDHLCHHRGAERCTYQRIIEE